MLAIFAEDERVTTHRRTELKKVVEKLLVGGGIIVKSHGVSSTGTDVTVEMTDQIKQ